MNLQLQQTEDGSHTLFIPDKNEHYHSTHGAIQEALTVYIQASLHFAFQAHREGQIPIVRVLEMGFGTGLNTFLTALEAQKAQIPVEYTSIEAYPLEKGIWERLNYATCQGIATGDSASRQAFPCHLLRRLRPVRPTGALANGHISKTAASSRHSLFFFHLLRPRPVQTEFAGGGIRGKQPPGTGRQKRNHSGPYSATNLTMSRKITILAKLLDYVVVLPQRAPSKAEAR